MSVLDVLVVSQYVAANACWSFRKWQSYTASRERLQNDVELESEILLRIFSLGKLTGGLLLINLWLLFLPVPRSSALQQLLGSDHAQLVRYHRWLGHASLLLGSIHGGLFYAYWLARRQFWRQALDWCGEASVNHLAGSLALLSCAAIWLTSLPAIRRANFQVFRKCHGAGFLGYVAFLGFHWPKAYAYALPGLILLALDAACNALAQNQAGHALTLWEPGRGWVPGERDPTVAALYFPAHVPPFTNSRPKASRALSEAEAGSGSQFFSAESGSTSAALSAGYASLPDSLSPSSSPSCSLPSQEFSRSEDLAGASSLGGGCPMRHVMLLVPSLASRDWHPFCASFVPGHLRVVVQRQGRWTAALLRALASGQLPTAKVSLPPAPTCEDWAGADRALLVGGGLAAVALGPVLEAIAALWRARSGSGFAAASPPCGRTPCAEPPYARPPYVSLVWAVRDREELGALDSHLEAIMDVEEEFDGEKEGRAPKNWPHWLQRGWDSRRWEVWGAS
ncbi:hypothetical protein H632_c300p0 [Helicosporidium sp. ATCC 50920]|nr:hypothetical protein H632_c300p0 [Helicosporidium sp. ATCC 50920]|eukprot:KDD76246.1 hypothetical protein H632_c300p0 [Helicosporidium sp. ATCC 50920]